MLKYSKSPKKSDQNISYDTYATMYNNVKRLQNIKFDPTKFYTIDSPDGLYISLQSQADSSSTIVYPKPFDLTSAPSEESSSEEVGSFYIASNMGKNICRILGTKYDVQDGDNVVFTKDYWKCTPFESFDGTFYAYLAFNRKDLEIYLHVNDFFPDLRNEVEDHKEYIDYRLLWIYGPDPDFITDNVFLPTLFTDCRNDYSVSGMI